MKSLDVFNHALAHRLVRHRTPGRCHILHHMVYLRRGRNGAGNRRMREDKLQEKSRPGIGAELCGPVRHWMTRDMLERAAPPEGPVDNDGNALVRR